MSERRTDRFQEEAMTPHDQMLLHILSHWILFRAVGEVRPAALALLNLGGNSPRENEGHKWSPRASKRRGQELDGARLSSFRLCSLSSQHVDVRHSKLVQGRMYWDHILCQ